MFYKNLENYIICWQGSGLWILRKSWFEAKIRGVNKVSGEKLHATEITLCLQALCVK